MGMGCAGRVAGGVPPHMQRVVGKALLVTFAEEISLGDSGCSFLGTVGSPSGACLRVAD